jgi:protein-disulfide isomerase
MPARIERRLLPVTLAAAALLSAGALYLAHATASPPTPQTLSTSPTPQALQSQAAKAAPPAAAPASPGPGAAPATPRPKTDPKLEAVSAWIAGIFPWGPGEVSVEEIQAIKVKGHKLLKASKTFGDARNNDQTFVVFDEASPTVIVGDPFLDEARAKAPRPVRTDADLAGVREQVQKFLRGRSRVVLDPSGDRPGFKGVKILVDSGYGPYEIGGFVTADDGALLIAGRAWDRKRSFVDQRKELIKLAGTPVQGPADATVTVVEYSDMQCGFCKKRTADWEPLLTKLGKSLKIRRYFKSFPLVNDHPWAFRASAAGRCFFEKNPALFFSWKSNVYSRQETLTVADLDIFAVDFAAANDVSEAQLKGCYLQEASSRKILSDLSEGYAIRVRATPTYIIDGVAVSWYADGLMEEFLRQTYLKGTANSPQKGAIPVKKGVK